MSDFPLFKYLDIETSSRCNRTCPTCIRNSHPKRKALSSWFEPNYLPVVYIDSILEQSIKMGFRGEVCLSHYNEPLLDSRIIFITKMVKSFGKFSMVRLVTNGDFITPELALQLDGILDKITVSMYMDEPVKSTRGKWIESRFKQTQVEVLYYSEHIATHFSPKFDVKALAEKHKNNPCIDTAHCIINHKGQYLLCCDDVIGNFGFGTIHDTTLQEYWFGEKHRSMVKMLSIPGGRLGYPYCCTCPRA